MDHQVQQTPPAHQQDLMIYRAITTDGTNLYVADSDNHKIRKIVIATGAVTTLAGSSSYGSTDGTGTSAKFKNLRGITTDGTNLYVTDYS